MVTASGGMGVIPFSCCADPTPTPGGGDPPPGDPPPGGDPSCDNPNCSVVSGIHLCGRVADLCTFTGSTYVGEVIVNQSYCGGGAGCPPGGVFGDDCVWRQEWNIHCGECCWGGGGGDPDDRIVGRVHRDVVGNYASGYSITSNDGKIASWDANPEPYYHIGRWPSGTNVQITLNDPDPGYDCEWSFNCNPNGGCYSYGNGCTASVNIHSGGYSPDWQNHLHFILKEPQSNLPPTCSISSCPVKLNTGQSYTFSATGSDIDGTITNIEMWSASQSDSPPASWTNICASASDNCSRDVSFDSEGDYYVICNASDDDGNWCTGNPWCPWLPNPPSGEDCTGWSDCTDGDLCAFSVVGERSWTIETEAICLNGMDHNRQVRTWYRFWPPNPPVDTLRPPVVGSDIFLITSTHYQNNVYVGMQDEEGNFLGLNPPPPHFAITYSNYWSPPTPNARWNRENLPQGNYRIEFLAPDPWCTNCLISIPNISLPVGSTGTILVSIDDESPGHKIDCVEFFVINDPDNTIELVGDNPVCDPSFQIDVRALSSGTPATIRAIATMDDGITTCEDESTVSTYAASWFQTQGGGLTSSQSLMSHLPDNDPTEYLIKSGSQSKPLLRRDPGSACYVTGIPSFGGGEVSETGWIAQTQYRGVLYSYPYFENKLPPGLFNENIGSDVRAGDWNGGVPYLGYEWYFYDGESSSMDINIIQDVTFTNRKVILFVRNANLNIHNRINLSDRSFFMAVVDGSIQIESDLGGSDPPHLEGIFVADGAIATPGHHSLPDVPLVVRGSIVASSISLGRDLVDNNSDTPAEFIEFAPDLLFYYPSILGARRLNWEEVAP